MLSFVNDKYLLESVNSHILNVLLSEAFLSQQFFDEIFLYEYPYLRLFKIHLKIKQESI